MRWMMYRWWCEGGGDRAWWVIESVFLRSPDKGFWACLGDIPPDMPRRPETWVSLYNLMMNLFGISRSSAILGSDSPQSNNRKDHSLWVTPFIPRERPDVKHAISGYLRLPQPLMFVSEHYVDNVRNVKTNRSGITGHIYCLSHFLACTIII